MRDRAVVLGGGIGGMAAALLLADRGLHVTLVEAAPRLAMGWRSAATPLGPADPGIRVPRESGDARADALVFHGHPGLAWHRIGPRAAEGHVRDGRLNAATGCLDLRDLPAAILGAARVEVLSRAFTPDPRDAAGSLADRLETQFGPTLLHAALRPACLSLLGAEPEALAWNAAEARLPARLVLADHAETDRLRGIGHLGARLAHPVAAAAPMGGEARAYLYPQAGGIGAWVAALDATLERVGVVVRTGCRLASLRLAGGRIRTAMTEDGAELPCDLLVLAATPRALPLPGLTAVPERSVPVAARLLAFGSGTPPPLHWITSCDPATPFLRLGFPDRLEGAEPRAPWRIVTELREGATAEALAASLARLGVVPDGAQPIATAEGGRGRFAVETRAARTARDTALAALGAIPNLALLRSAAGGHALAGELVADAARLAAAVAAPASAAA